MTTRSQGPDRPLYVILGATGGVGRGLVTEAAARGHRVRAVSRSATTTADLPAEVERMDADLGTAEGAAGAVDGADVVLHAAQPPYTRWPAEFPALTRRIADATAAAGAKLVMADNLYMYGPQPGGRAMTEDMPYAATDRKGRVRAAMATELLDRHSRGDLRVALGRASDYYGPRGTVSALGEGFFGAALRGRTVNAIGSVQTLHSLSYLPDFAAGLLTLAERDAADGRAWHLPVAAPLTTRAFADLIAAEIGRPVRLRASGARTLRLLGVVVPMLREVAGVAYQWERPFIADDSAFRGAFPDAVRVTSHPAAVAATVAWFRLGTATPVPVAARTLGWLGPSASSGPGRRAGRGPGAMGSRRTPQ